MKNKLITLMFGAAASLAMAGVAGAGTLDDVRQHGFVQCGVSQGLMGFSVPDAQNNWTGMDVDFCRHRRRRAGRCHQGEVHAAHRQGALHGAAIG
jgi:ABC-type amino acid transport substrate-binding protein